MRRAPRRVRLDLVAPVHRAPFAGLLLCALGLAVAIAVGFSFDQKLAERSRLDAALGATARPHHTAPTPESLRDAAEAMTIERQLHIPWTRKALGGYADLGSVGNTDCEYDTRGTYVVRLFANWWPHLDGQYFSAAGPTAVLPVQMTEAILEAKHKSPAD